MKEIHCKVSGRVQGVMFRDFVRRKANKLGAVGFVFNDIDGTVVVVAQGAGEMLEQLQEQIQKGSLLSRVDDVVATWREPRKSFQEFKIVR